MKGLLFIINEILNFIQLIDIFLIFEEDSQVVDMDDIILIITIINLINPLIEVLLDIFDLTQKKQRDHDAYKLIWYCSEYRLEYFTECNVILLHNIWVVQSKREFFFFFCRMDYLHSNMWQIFIRNWNHFYWLTGEIPPTFNLLMDELNDYLPTKKTGHKCALNLENQVLVNSLIVVITRPCNGQ